MKKPTHHQAKNNSKTPQKNINQVELSGRKMNGAWLLLSLSLFISASFIAWEALRLQSFNYGLWYEVLDIDEFILKYGSQNRYRDGFETTDKIEHIRIFADITHAISNNGAGLRSLHYTHQATTSSDAVQTQLLREPEIVHLHDVANLISTYTTTSYFSILVSIIGIALIIFFKIQRPNWQGLVLGWLVLSLAATILVFSIGPKTVFYQLHKWIFPDDHQWFFYYQDSLMTTLMKAPILFAYISASWATLTLLLFIALLLTTFKTVSRFNPA